MSFQTAKQQAVTQVNLYVASLLDLKAPTQWSHGEGRRSRGGKTEALLEAFRGSRDGMLRKAGSPVLEARYDGVEEHQPVRIRKRSRTGSYRESEGSIVPFEGAGQHNPARGKGPYFVHATKEWRMGGLQRC